MHVRSHRRAAKGPGVGQQVHVRAAQPQCLPDPQPGVSSKITKKRSRGRRQQPSTAATCSAVSASGNGVCARAFSARARTVRNWPDSPASKPGGVNRSHRGSDSRSATPASITPVRAQNRSSSHTAVMTALTVDPDRSRPPGPGWPQASA